VFTRPRGSSRLLFPLLAVLAASSVILARQFLRVTASESVQLEWQELPAYEAEAAAYHVGERAIVCGKVASTAYVSTVRGKPTFLNLEKPYPDQLFTVVIWDRNRSKFPNPPDVRFRDARICVAGLIEEDRGVPQIEVKDPEQIDHAVDAGDR